MNSLFLTKSLRKCLNMALNGCVICVLLSFLLFQLSLSDFPSDYLGNFLSEEEYNSKEFCWSKICMLDSGRLIYSASHDSKQVNPCDDFPTFAMGEFLEHRVPNERYAKLGFYSDLDAQYFEKQKKVLLEPVKPDSPKLQKIMKSFFKKCIKSGDFK